MKKKQEVVLIGSFGRGQYYRRHRSRDHGSVFASNLLSQGRHAQALNIEGNHAKRDKEVPG